MPDVAHALARALISAHGSEALEVAARAIATVLELGMPERVAEWELVAKAVRKIQEEGPPRGWERID